MLAIKDYESLTKKRKEKKELRKRLIEQKEGLEMVVNQLTEKKTRALDEIFQEVNKNFKEIYAELSNGGSAELIIENPENPFEGGLLISARPACGVSPSKVANSSALNRPGQTSSRKARNWS